MTRFSLASVLVQKLGKLVGVNEAYWVKNSNEANIFLSHFTPVSGLSRDTLFVECF